MAKLISFLLFLCISFVPVSELYAQGGVNTAFERWLENKKTGNSPVKTDVSKSKTATSSQKKSSKEKKGLIPSVHSRTHLKGRFYAPSKSARSGKARLGTTTSGASSCHVNDGSCMIDDAYLPPVRDQESETCWAHAVYASLESNLMVANDIHDFDEMQMAENHEFDWDVDDGGNSDIATAFLSRWAGPTEQDGDDTDVVKHMQNMYNLPPVDSSFYGASYYNEGAMSDGGTFVSNVKQALISYGPVYVGISAQDAFWPDRDNSGSYFYAYDCNAPFNQDVSDEVVGNCNIEGHAVSIVGWDDSVPASKFKIKPNPKSSTSYTPAGPGAFIVRNSWGEDYGHAAEHGGYFYISYYDSSIGGMAAVYETVESTDNYKKQYSHDIYGNTFDTGCLNFDGAGRCVNTKTAMAANIFQTSSNSDIKAVSFYTTDLNTQYEVEVYYDLNTTTTPVVAGKRICSASGSFANAGYHTLNIDCDEQPSGSTLKAGKYFSVVVKLTNPNYEYPLACEAAYPGYSSGASAQPGQSFYRNTAEYEWKDLTAFGDDKVEEDINHAKSNFPIKAFFEEDNTGPVWPSGAKVRNGVSADEDYDTTTSDNELSANWDEAEDEETGVSGYRYAISAVAPTEGKAPEFLIDWTDVGNQTSVTRGGLSLSYGTTYYFAIKAYNKYGSESEMLWSRGQLVKYALPPSVVFVNEGYYEGDFEGVYDDDYTVNTSSLSVHWGTIPATQDQSEPYIYRYAIGTSRGSTDTTKGWLEEDYNDQRNSYHINVPRDALNNEIVLEDGKTYYFTVITYDENGRHSAPVMSDGITVDRSTPTLTSLAINGCGGTGGCSVEYGTFSGDFEINTDYERLESSPTLYFVAVSTDGTTEVRQNFVVTNTSSTTWHFSTVISSTVFSTGDGEIYFSATTKAGRTGTGIAHNVSNSFVIVHSKTDDQTVPVWPQGAVVRDGLGTEDIEKTSSLTSLSANWDEAVDQDSGIDRYEYCIGTSRYDCSVYPWTANEANNVVTVNGLSLSYGTTYYFTVRAVNNSGLVSLELSSSGQWIDEASPGRIPNVYCSFENEPPLYVKWVSSFSARWDESDSSVGRERIATSYRYAIGTEPGWDNVIPWQDNGLGTSVLVSTKAWHDAGRPDMSDGNTYYFSVKALNALSSESEINYCKVIVDITAPRIEEITLHTRPQNTGETISGTFSVSEAIDRISGIPELAFKVSDKTYPLAVSAHSGEDFYWDFNGYVEPLEGMEGNAVFVFLARDKAGNEGTTIVAGSSFTINALKNNSENDITVQNNEGCKVLIPAGASDKDLKVFITEASTATVATADANSVDSKPLRLAYLARDFNAYDADGNQVSQFAKDVEITFPYPDTDGDGLTDGDYVDIRTLFVHYLDPKSMKWIPLANSRRNQETREVSAKTGHFSIYSLRSVNSASIQFHIKPSPNPCYFTRNVVQFLGIPIDAYGVKIFIYNSAGELVRELPEGEVTWDGRTKNGSRAASGVYMYLVKTENRGKSKGKFYSIW